jgi:class 3 adenylate cyclase
MRPVVLSQTVELGASVEAVWPLISDTNRLNHALGLPTMSFTPAPPGTGSSARLIGETTILGVKMQFEEQPFEWSYCKRIRILRKAKKGPVVSVATSCSLEPLPRKRGGGGGDSTGCRLNVTVEILPRHAPFRPLAWTLARINLSRMIGLSRELDAFVVDQASSPLAIADSRANDSIVRSAIADMKKHGVDAAVADRLGVFVRDAPDYELIRMRPFELAGEWAMNKREVLRALLHGVPAGLVELRWGIICPSCRTASDEANVLAEISLEGHCQLCDISFDLDLDRAVEATFIAHPSARAVTTQMFCSGGPGRVPHVFSQVVLEPGEAKPLDGPTEPGRYRIFARGGASASVEVALGAPTAATAAVEDGAVRPVDIRVGPAATITVTNATKEGRHVKLERMLYATDAATAHIVSTMPEFRSLFSSDLLKASTPLKVSRAAILFSDLTGSTALYTKVGDAAAFRLVDDHFDMMRNIVSERGGSFVKTMGDAVMAAFSDVEACAQAAMDALARFETFRVDRAHGEHIGMKLGVNAGPCYVVTANGTLDYFGQTVNVASRVQHLANTGELVVAASLFEELTPEQQARVTVGEHFEATVKGVEKPLLLVRLTAKKAPGA